MDRETAADAVADIKAMHIAIALDDIAHGFDANTPDLAWMSAATWKVYVSRASSAPQNSGALFRMFGASTKVRETAERMEDELDAADATRLHSLWSQLSHDPNTGGAPEYVAPLGAARSRETPVVQAISRQQLTLQLGIAASAVPRGDHS